MELPFGGTLKFESVKRVGAKQTQNIRHFQYLGTGLDLTGGVDAFLAFNTRNQW